MEEKKVAKAKGAQTTNVLVKVKNLTFDFFVQPSTGIRIPGKGEAELKEDGWLQNQISAKLLAKV